MRTLSIQQPWGTLICCGLKDVENRKWALKSTPMRVLIHTGARRQNINEKNMPLIWWLPVENYQTMGILGSIADMPTSAIVGVATIDRCDTDNKSIWAQRGPGAEYKWVMRDVQLFKEPILNVKGKLGIFDIPEINEDNLPECVSIPKIERNDRHLTLPLCREAFEQLNNGDADTISLNLTDDNLSLFAKKGLKPLPTETITFVCEDETLDASVVKYQICPVSLDDNGEPTMFEDAFRREYFWYKVYITIE